MMGAEGQSGQRGTVAASCGGVEGTNKSVRAKRHEGSPPVHLNDPLAPWTWMRCVDGTNAGPELSSDEETRRSTFWETTRTVCGNMAHSFATAT